MPRPTEPASPRCCVGTHCRDSEPPHVSTSTKIGEIVLNLQFQVETAPPSSHRQSSFQAALWTPAWSTGTAGSDLSRTDNHASLASPVLVRIAVSAPSRMEQKREGQGLKQGRRFVLHRRNTVTAAEIEYAPNVSDNFTAVRMFGTAGWRQEVARGSVS